ncbi:hypothetical protein [Halocatena halophila]|uniref:hypothetical protein n=1 Tax=Halocatena halophila TaxID=2814576 RepID=UPI002ED41ACD
MVNRSNSQTVDRITDLRIDDKINVRSLETGREDAFIVAGFDLNIVNHRPEVTAQLLTPAEEPAPIVVFDTPSGICLSPTDVPQRQEIDAEVILFESRQQQPQQTQFR